jgi:hypothetical protein
VGQVVVRIDPRCAASLKLLHDDLESNNP